MTFPMNLFLINSVFSFVLYTGIFTRTDVNVCVLVCAYVHDAYM